jgi:predicted DNA-binding protein
MSEMVRIQVDLPYEMVESLKLQSKVKGITMSQQILEALRAYLASQEDPILRADDVIFRIAGEMDSGVGDLSANHDRCLRGPSDGSERSI